MLRNSPSCNSGNTGNHPVTGLSSDKLSMPFRPDRKWRLFERWEKVVHFPWGICPFFLFEGSIYIYTYTPQSTLVDFPLFSSSILSFSFSNTSPIKVFSSSYKNTRSINKGLKLAILSLWKGRLDSNLTQSENFPVASARSR